MKRGKKFVALFAALALSFSMMTTVSFAAFADDDVIDEPAAFADDDVIDEPAAFANDDIADEPAVDADTANNGQAADDEAAGEEDSELGNEVDGEEEIAEEPALAAAPAAAPADEVVLAAEETELEPAAQTIKSISLTSTNPVCGTFVKCQGATMHWPPDYQPAPPISVDTPNCSIYGAWWVEGDGPDTAHVYPRNRDITVDGTKYYKFVLNLHPDEGYEFTSETTVTISTGSVLSSEFYPGDEWNASAIIAVFEIPATHDWGEWTVTKEPTTTAPGERVRVCKHFLTPPRLGLFPRLTTLRQPLTTALIPPTVAAVRRLPATVPVPPAVLSIGARVARERPFPRASFPLVLRQQAMSIMVSLPSPTRVIRLRAAWTVSAPVPRSAA